MPKSRHRKNHKKKLASWKSRKLQEANASMKKMEQMRETLMETYKKTMEEAKAKKDEEKNNVDPQTL
jgi:hypothetical protein|tara:strand:- start:17237 stop:17437 length:201 start_codon:yes stop_codon:yes gene_type:complete